VPLDICQPFRHFYLQEVLSVKKTGLFLVLVASLVLGLVAVPGFAGASDVDTSVEAMYQPLSCANGLPALANYNARIRRFASITSAAYPIVIPSGTMLPAVAMDHTGGWLLLCYAGIVGWSSRDLYTPGADWVLFQTLPILGQDMSAPPPSTASDRDGDGYFDFEDYCPDTAAGYAPGSAAERQPPYTGCPHDAPVLPDDSDGDGYPDGEDYCPSTPAGYAPGSAAERQRPYTGCPHDPAVLPTDSDGDGYFDLEDYCPNTAAGYAPGSAAERQPPYTGCPHADALTQCLNYSGTGTCINLRYGKVDLATYGGGVVAATCMFVDTKYSIPALGEGCWVPVIAKAFGNTQFVVEAVAAESAYGVQAGLRFQGWAQTEAFGPVSGDLAKVPSY
jgi:hypothetical protein